MVFLKNIIDGEIVLIEKRSIPVVGPSHCVRFKHAMETAQLPVTQQEFVFIGVGGMPIWSPRVTRELAANGGCAAPFFIVGDFRFGNGILKNTTGELAFPVAREYLAVDKDLINEENDKLLYNLSMKAAGAIVKEIPAARLFFWDLTIREFENRSGGRYQVDGVYKHPVWNLDTVLNSFHDVAVDSRDMLSCAERLFIDSSGHPSLLGWIYMLQRVEARSDVDLATLVSKFDRAFDQALRKLFGDRSFVITGDSKFTRILDKFAKLGIFRLPAGCVITSLRNAGNIKNVDTCLYFPPTVTYTLDEAEIAAQAAEVARHRAALEEKFAEVSVLFYDNWAFECVSKRKDYSGMYVSRYESGKTCSLEAQTCPAEQRYQITDSTDFEGLVELNNTLLPTTLGILEILGRAISGCGSEEVRDVYGTMLAEIVAPVPNSAI